MEKNVTLSASSQTEVNFQSVANSLQTAVAKMAKKAMAPLEWLRSYYSNICEKQLTMGQTGTLVSAQLAFIATAFPADAPWLFRIGCGVWLAVSLLQCKKFLSKD